MHIVEKLNELRNKKRKILSLFITAGYPTLESTVPLAVSLAHAGADIVEIGIPFSDPIADGPTIQKSSQIALQNGITTRITFEIAREIRRRSDIPLILMGYANSIYTFGLGNFLGTCKEIGVDGIIIPDLPLEESKEYRTVAKQNNIATIFLAAPTTPMDRLTQLDKASTGFLYCVSVTGVTGERQSISEQSERFLVQARAYVRNNPMLVGFGISTPEDARRISRLSDGVIIGSALLTLLHASSNNHAIENAAAFTKELRQALDAPN